MFINNIDISTYNASVSKKLIQPTEITIEKERFKINFNQISSKQSFKKISVKLLFQADTRDLAYQNISSFMVNLVDENEIKFKNLSHYYHVFLTSSSIDDTDFDEWLYLNLEFEGYEHGEEVIEFVNRVPSKTINVGGNTETPAIVEIVPSIDTIDLVLTGLGDDPITIKNLSMSKRIIINGESGLVTQDGTNKFADTDLWNFPSLKPGVNKIIVSRNTVDITIRYKPRFI